MIAEIGHFALVLAFLVALVQAVLPLFGAHRQDESLMRLASVTALTTFALLVISFASIAWSFLASDFSVRLVAANSEINKPTIYKLTGVWANHEGSMLLWVLILSLFAAAIAAFGNNLPLALKARVLAVQAMIGSAFLAFLIFTSNPFERLIDAPANGSGMNPILQDPGLAIHPPCLYLGYVGFSVAFSFAVAALIEGKVDAAWARWVRPWVLAAWCFLTLGITLGSFWAYYILGWGGWWFWDPVENVSFMPWLAGTALLHSALVVERRHAMVTWTILLAILTFSLSLVGTFVVRSGVLTSVHAFAVDPARGVFILAILLGATGGALALYSIRMSSVKSGSAFALFSREGGLVLNNALLVVACGTVFAGTFYPLFIDLMTSDKISVGPPFYNRTFVPLFIPILVTMTIGPYLKWKRDNWRQVAQKLRVPFGCFVLVVIAVAAFGQFQHLLSALGLGLAAWIVAGSSWALIKRIKLGSATVETSLGLLRTTPRSFFGLILGHAGLGFVVAAITTVMTWQQENILAMKVGDHTTIAGYDVVMSDVIQTPGPNYDAERATFQVSDGGKVFSVLQAERRFYTMQQRQVAQTGIRTNFISNLYFALGDPDSNGKWTVRIYYHPLAPWLWIGGFIMALGGFISLSDRRFRVGVAQPKPMPHAPLNAPLPAGAA
jgi:cytochrome c-type biogenesis protein CcmF